jgi:hypothetical protein
MRTKPANLENTHFWQLPNNSLRYIIADCNAAIQANPSNPKCYTGRGNYADQINDAATILGWRAET